jgi:hypothetical protein
MLIGPILTTTEVTPTPAKIMIELILKGPALQNKRKGHNELTVPSSQPRLRVRLRIRQSNVSYHQMLMTGFVLPNDRQCETRPDAERKAKTPSPLLA